MAQDTIFAPATARGKAGVSILRLSGPRAWDVVKILCGSLPEPRRASIRTLRLKDGSVLDQALVLLFEAGQSFTGERSAELQVHGSPSIVRALLSVLSEIDSCRVADPGEFTRRALENDRMDMAQVEGLADLIDAETEAQRRQAQRVFSGETGKLVEIWRNQLTRAAALTEATIDFADEELPKGLFDEVRQLVTEVHKSLAGQREGYGFAERIRDGFEVVILGAPNVGKSTLLNCLAGRDAAITSEIAGTTRDVVEVRMDLNGLPVSLLDTAGLRETSDPVEALGIERALARAQSADLRIVLTEGLSLPEGYVSRETDIVVQSKADLGVENAYSISAKTGAGVDQLIKMVSDKLAGIGDSSSLLIRERHRIAVDRALDALALAQSNLQHSEVEAEILAEYIYNAIRSLDSLVGRIDVEAILDEIFSSFCLGK